MSIAELTAPRLPRHAGRNAQKQLDAARTTLRRAIHRTYTRAIRASLRWHRRQYYIATAYRDVRRGIARNEDIFLASLLIVGIVLFAFASTSAQILLVLFLNLSALNDQLDLSFIPVVTLFCVSLATLALWVASWMANLVSLSLMDGANRKRLTSLRFTVRRSLMHATRTATSWLLYLVVVFGPISLIAAYALFYLLFATMQTDTDILQTLVLSTSAAAVWLLYALTSYGLVPHVALFEPDVPLLKTLRRSRQLVIRRGRPFIFALYALCASAIGAAYVLSNYLQPALGSVASLLFIGTTASMLLTLRLGMTMLYRKRKLARWNIA